MHRARILDANRLGHAAARLPRRNPADQAQYVTFPGPFHKDRLDNTPVNDERSHAGPLTSGEEPGPLLALV